MKEQLNEKLTVQQAVRDVMEKNISKWQHVPALKSQYDRFVLNLKKIEDHQLVIAHDLAPLKEKRKLAKDQLIERVFPVSSALCVYASDVGDRKLKNQVKGKLREMQKLSSADLIKYGKSVLETIRSMMEKSNKSRKKEAIHPVEDYGLSEPVLLKLQTALDTLEAAINEYCEASLNRKKSRVKLVKRLRENELLLKKKMDHMIHLFRDNQKAFYNAYLKSRLYVEPAEPEAGTPDEKGTAPSASVKKSASSVKGKPASTKTKPATTARGKKVAAKPASGQKAAGKPAAEKPATGKPAPDKPAGGQTA
jgi:hypothetical protein